MSKKVVTEPDKARLLTEVEFLKAKLKAANSARASLLTFISDLGLSEKFKSYERAGWIKPPAGFLEARGCLWAPLNSTETKN